VERNDPFELIRSLKAQIEANAERLRRTRRIVADMNNHLAQNDPGRENKDG
jgi:hypothetical protein